MAFIEGCPHVRGDHIAFMRGPTIASVRGSYAMHMYFSSFRINKGSFFSISFVGEGQATRRYQRLWLGEKFDGLYYH